MKRVKMKETTLVSRRTRSKKRDEEASADEEKDLVSSLPLDLKLQILLKLRPKSIAKLNSVSKLWSSIVREKYFTQVYLSRSLTRPCFLFTYGSQRIQRFHSHSQEDPCSFDNTSITTYPIAGLSQPVRGLICGRELYKKASILICNPSTGQCVALPRLKTLGEEYKEMNISNFIGYDPVIDQYKVLCIITSRRPDYDYEYDEPFVEPKHQVYTLGAKEKTWRMIECKHWCFPATNELCRDGVIYYGAWYNYKEVIVSFDVRSEDFNVIKLSEDVKLIYHFSQYHLVNYHGNMALVDRTGFTKTTNVDLWVLMDVKKQEWCKISILLPDVVWTWSNIFYCLGTISTGEIIFTPHSFFSITISREILPQELILKELQMVLVLSESFWIM